jgi:hypothetical protein
MNEHDERALCTRHHSVKPLRALIGLGSHDNLVTWHEDGDSPSERPRNLAPLRPWPAPTRTGRRKRSSPRSSGEILRRWGSRAGVLDRLSNVSRELERLHRDEARLLIERDELVTLLRSHGLSWNALSSRTRLSRQALMKRSVQPSL